MTIELFKQFLKPDWRKILLGLIFFLSSSYPTFVIVPCNYLPNGPSCIPENSILVGFPFMYFSQIIDNINYINLIVDLLFWYFISCLVIFVLDKIKNKKQ